MKRIVLLDGGVGQEIFRRANKPLNPLWSTGVMMDNPNIVRDVHKDFIACGAKVITINAYTCTPTRLRAHNQGHRFKQLQCMAMQVAHEARKEMGTMGRGVQIAGCLPPLVGSYVSNTRTPLDLYGEYKKIVEVQKHGVDLFIVETMSSIKDALAATKAALSSGKNVLVSFAPSDDCPQTLHSGERVKDAVNTVCGYPLAGVLLNCCHPETIHSCLPFLQLSGKVFGAYANTFCSVNALKFGGCVTELVQRKDLDEDMFVENTMHLIENGARIVGGCCEVGPLYIKALHDRMLQSGYLPVPFEQ